MLKTAIAAPHKDPEIDPDIESIRPSQGEDGIITLSTDSATVVARNLDRIGFIIFEILDQLTEHNKLDKDAADPRLASLISYLENSGEELFNAGMQANHLRDGTGG